MRIIVFWDLYGKLSYKQVVKIPAPFWLGFRVEGFEYRVKGILGAARRKPWFDNLPYN